MASHAVMNGVPVPVVSRLLGHSNVRMTLRYAHLADKDIEAAAERVGAAMARAMALEHPYPARAQPRKHRRCDNGTMTKSQLIERIARKQSHVVERDVAQAANMMLEHMTAWLAGGEEDFIGEVH